METVAATTTDLMDDGVYWNAIPHNFGFSAVAATKFTDNYSTSRDLIISNPKQIKDTINQQNKIYCNHAGTNQRCYINATNMNRILEFHRWAVFTKTILKRSMIPQGPLLLIVTGWITLYMNNPRNILRKLPKAKYFWQLPPRSSEQTGMK